MCWTLFQQDHVDVCALANTNLSDGTKRKKPHPFGMRFCVYGALGWIRTTDRSVRSRVLYPAELRVHFSLISEVAHYR